MSLFKTFASFSICLLCPACVLFDLGDAGSKAGSADESGQESKESQRQASQVELQAPALKAAPGEDAKASAARFRSSSAGEYRSWMKSCMQEALSKTVPLDQPWSKEAASFAKGAILAEAQEPGAQSWDALSNQAQALAAKGCEDPFIRFWIGEAVFRSGKPSAAVSHLRKAAAKLQRWEYPKLALALASDRLAACSEDPSSQGLAKAAMNLAAAAMAESAADSEPYAPSERFAAYAGLNSLLSSKLNPKFWRSASAAASMISKYPKQLQDALKLKARMEEAEAAKEDSRELAKAAYKEAKELAAKNPGIPEFPALALEALALAPDAGSASEAKRLLDVALEADPSSDEACLAYVDYLAAAFPEQPEKLLAFGRSCLATKRFDTQVPRVFLSALLKLAAGEPGGNWREAFAVPGVAEDLEKLYLGMIEALPPDEKSQRDALAMEKTLLLCWCGDYEAAKDLFSKVPAEAALLNSAFNGFQLPWKPRSIPELESEIRGFTGVQKAVFQQWDDAMRKADFENSVKLASKLIAGNASDKPLRQLIRVRTAWRLIGEKAERISSAEAADPLSYAIKAKRLDAVKFLMENGYELKRKGRESSLPLLLAFSNGLTEDLVKLIVSKGADVDYRDAETGETPLSMAIERKMPSAAEFIAEMGADPNAKLLASGKTALHLACLGSMPSLARTLLKRGAKPNALDAKGETPLHYAVAAGSADCVQALVAKGADPSVKNEDGLSPLDLAAKGGDEQILQILKSAPPPKPPR